MMSRLGNLIMIVTEAAAISIFVVAAIILLALVMDVR